MKQETKVIVAEKTGTVLGPIVTILIQGAFLFTVFFFATGQYKDTYHNVRHWFMETQAEWEVEREAEKQADEFYKELYRESAREKLKKGQ